MWRGNSVQVSRWQEFAEEEAHRREELADKKLHQMYSEAIENFRTQKYKNSLAFYERKLKQPIINEIVVQSKFLIEDYIYSRFKHPETPAETNLTPDISPTPTVIKASQKGPDFRQVTLRNAELKGLRVPSDVSLEIQKLGKMLEDDNPHLYINISKQLVMPLRSDVAVRKALVCIGDFVFKTGVTWGRIVGLFAVAAAVAAECLDLGHSHHIRTIINTFAELIEKHAATWICRQGGWAAVMTAFRTRSQTRYMWLLTLLGFVVGTSLVFST